VVRWWTRGASSSSSDLWSVVVAESWFSFITRQNSTKWKGHSDTKWLERFDWLAVRIYFHLLTDLLTHVGFPNNLTWQWTFCLFLKWLIDLFAICFFVHLFITSAKEVMFLPFFVCLSVCLSVCLCVSKITEKDIDGSFQIFEGISGVV